MPQVTLPIGISFFTFQGLSYVIDVYRGDAAVQRDPLKLALYIAFFPQLVAGPIVRYTTVAEEIDERHESVSEFSAGAVRFLFGLGKKMLLANAVARIADAAFAAVMPSVLFAWLGAVAYTFQIYFDFSAYSDMAIGLGRMFGFHFWRISITPMSRGASRSSGGAGTFHFPPGSATMCISRSAATAARGRAMCGTSSSSGS